MSKKYKKYIEYVVNDIEAPFFINMKDNYGLKGNEYNLVLSKLYDQPVSIEGNRVYGTDDNIIYYETIGGYWYKNEYDEQGNIIYYEQSDGYIIDNR